VGPLRQPGQVERLAHSRSAARAGDATERGEHIQRLGNRQLDVEVAFLGHDAEARPGELRLGGQPVAQHGDVAGIGEGLSGQHPHGGRFPGAIGPEQAEANASGDLQVQAVDRR
jgi:hypothetical protein